MIKINNNFIKAFKEDLAKIRLTTPYEMRGYYRPAANIIKKDVVATIERGNSPVTGNRRFVDYSSKYKKLINKGVYPGKKLRPINLKLSGRMLRSIAAKITQSGFTIYFTSKLAKIHSTEGPGGRKDKIRKVVATDKEKWKTSVILGGKRYLEQETRKKLISKLRRI